MSDLLQIELPYPPSMNRYWRNVGHRTLLSKEGREFKAKVDALLHRRGVRPLDGPLAVTIWAWMPDARRRDVDNLLKPLLDALTGWAYHDDSQADDLRIRRAGKERGGTVMVQIKPCKPLSLDPNDFREAMQEGP